MCQLDGEPAAPPEHGGRAAGSGAPVTIPVISFRKFRYCRDSVPVILHSVLGGVGPSRFQEAVCGAVTRGR